MFINLCDNVVVCFLREKPAHKYYLDSAFVIPSLPQSDLR